MKAVFERGNLTSGSRGITQVSMSELSELLSRHYKGEGSASALPGLRIHASLGPSAPKPLCDELLLCVIAKGRKRVYLGGETLEYDPMTYLVASLSLPVTSQIVETPYLSLSLRLEPETLASLLLEMPAEDTSVVPPRAVGVSPLKDDLLDPLMRFVRLLDRPRDIPILAPLFERELLYRLLQGPHASLLRQTGLPSSRLSQIRRAIQLIRERFEQPLRIETLAKTAGMSLPTFHRHFKAVTSVSPHQFQKRLRLQEARRILLADETDAANAGFRVGYESPSQFSRDYRRFFGAPPAKDSKRVRSGLGGASALEVAALA